MSNKTPSGRRISRLPDHKREGKTKTNSGPAFADVRRRKRAASRHAVGYLKAKAAQRAAKGALQGFRKHPRKVMAMLKRHNLFPFTLDGTAAQQRQFLREAYEAALKAA